MPRRALQQLRRRPSDPSKLALSATVALLVTGIAPARGVAAAPELSAVTTAAELSYGRTLAVTGSVAEQARGLGGVALALQASAYPFRGFMTIAHLTSAPDGSFAFSDVKLDRNTRLRVVTEASVAASSPTLAVTVDPSPAINATSLGAGRTRLSVRVGHTTNRASPSVDARWYVAAAGTRLFRLAAITPTREISPGLTYASAVIVPPSERFVFRVCLNPAWELAMGSAASHGPCPQRDYRAPRDAG